MMSVYDITGNEIISGDSIKIPYYIPDDQTDQYAGNTMNADQFIALYDAMLGKHGSLTVTKELIGKDQSNSYNIYKYIFEPVNYERTILISSGMHGIEITPMFTLLTIMQNMISADSDAELFKYLREKVRIIVVPLQNPWGFSQSPRVYPNSRMVNENRNFSIKSEWEDFDAPAYGDTSNPFKGKGTAPFSELETINMRSVLYEYMHDIDFWFDLHSSMGWDYDYYVQCNSDDKYMHDAIADALSNSIEPYLKNVAGISAIKGLFNDPDTALKLHYTYKVLNISCCTVEMTPARFGGSECGSADLKMYQLQFCSYLIAALNYFVPRAKANNNHKYNQNIVIQSKNGTWYRIGINNTGDILNEEM